MKTLKRLLIMALAVIMSASTLVGCRDKSDPNAYVPDDADPNKVIRVERIKNGHGDEWTNQLKQRFEAAFPGYYMELRPSTNDMGGDTVARLLGRGYNKSKTDMFITGNVTDNMINTKNDYTNGTATAADLTDLVFNQKAYTADLDAEGNVVGEAYEEEKTVMEKIHPSMGQWLYDSVDTDKIYGMPYINSVAGLAFNKTFLAQFGYTEGPRTTKELFKMAENIYLGKKADGTSVGQTAPQSGLYPFTYFTGAQYGGSAYYTWLAQQDPEWYLEFQSFTKNYGTENAVRRLNDGYEMYKNKDILQEPLEVLFFAYDPQLAANGSTTDTLDRVQSKLVSKGSDRAVFMFNGDWVMQEVLPGASWAKDDLDFIQTPILSSIGTEVFTDKTEAQADELLSYVVKLVDENKSVDEIKADVKANKGYDMTTAQVERIAYARGTFFTRAIEGKVHVAADSPKKEICAMVCRFIAGEIGADTIAKYSNENSVFASGENKYNDAQFLKHSSAISVNRYNTPVRWESLGLRKDLSLGGVFYTQGEFLNKLWDKDVTKSMYANGALNGNTWANTYAKNASERIDAVYTLFKDNWQTRINDNNVTA